MNGYTGTGYEPAGIVHEAEYYFAPDMPEGVQDQLRKLAEAASISAKDIDRFAEAVAKFGEQPTGPTTYTNRAARRARAKAERKN